MNFLNYSNEIETKVRKVMPFDIGLFDITENKVIFEFLNVFYTIYYEKVNGRFYLKISEAGELSERYVNCFQKTIKILHRIKNRERAKNSEKSNNR